jgi:hypothetical protein
MADEIRLRSACDRCHSQKLRCPKKKTGESSCNRCSKARAACTFSPFRQKKQIVTAIGTITTSNSAIGPMSTLNEDGIVEEYRDIKAKRKRASGSLHHSGVDSIETTDLSTSTDFGIVRCTATSEMLAWVSDKDATPSQVISTSYSAADPNFNVEIPEFLNFDQPILEMPLWYPSKELTSPCSMQPISLTLGDIEPLSLQTEISSWSISPLNGYFEIPQPCELIAQSKSVLTPASLVRQLSELSVELYECSLTVPPLTIYGQTPLTPEEVNKYSGFMLEDVVILTQKTINLYPVFMTALFGSSNTSADNSSNIDHPRISELSTNASPEYESFAAPNIAVDYSAIHLMLSCHLRLISIWEQLLQHMASSLKQPHGCFHGASQALQCAPPTFRLGAYVPPGRLAINLHLMVFSAHFKQLYDYADELSMRLEDSSDPTPPPNSFPRASFMSQKAVADVKERAKGISTNLTTLVNVLLESGLIDQLI